MAALRSSDMSSYMALLQQTKNKRLQEVLAQTDACLAQIARKLGQATLGRTAPSAGEVPWAERYCCMHGLVFRLSCGLFQTQHNLI